LDSWTAAGRKARFQADLVFRSADGKTIWIWRQKQGSPLTAAWRAQGCTLTLPRAVAGMAAGDVDGDGKKEFFAVLTQGGLAVWRQ